ncbi:MAG: low-complexity tail membrane protein [Kovacikia sp.]
MRSFWSDPYLWIHLAGLAALPLFLELCLIGFSVGDPFLPTWLELLLVAAVGIAPILWMQWKRPFYIFSLVAVALKPGQLTEDQRRLLTLFKSQRNRILAVFVPAILLFVLAKIYGIAAIATSVVPFPVEWRLLGLLLAAIAFLGSNLFTQVPVSVLSVMLTSESTFSTTAPYTVEQIRQNFSLLGFQLNQVLPALIPDAQPLPVTASPAAPEGSPPAIGETVSNRPPESAPPPPSEAETASNLEKETSPTLTESVVEPPGSDNQPETAKPPLETSAEETNTEEASTEEASTEEASTEEISADVTPSEVKPEASPEQTALSQEDIWEE